LLGKIEIKDVHFSYPSRPHCGVLSGINITVEAGKTVAFVGHSGCGKSTIIQLLQRFYDPSKGQIIIDNHDIKSLNVGWFRKQLGVVRQEPDLFNGTISENLRLAKEDATDEEIIQVCKQADAHEFIMGFPEGYETMLGDRGALVSGGQKQR
jgi:ATP-binding cassette subfamily B (MDR/TAP) protein 1